MKPGHEATSGTEHRVLNNVKTVGTERNGTQGNRPVNGKRGGLHPRD